MAKEKLNFNDLIEIYQNHVDRCCVDSNGILNSNITEEEFEWLKQNSARGRKRKASSKLRFRNFGLIRVKGTQWISYQIQLEFDVIYMPAFKIGFQGVPVIDSNYLLSFNLKQMQ